jgi:hypothetical protein
MKRCCLIIALLLAIVSVGSANMLSDPGFETGGSWLKTGNVGTEPWGSRSFATGMVFYGWTPSPAGFSQEVAAVSGTYTFAIWACRESNYLASSTQIRIEWLNASGVSIQSTTVGDYSSLPNDGSYHHIFVSGTCTSSDLARVRVSVNGSWSLPGVGACSFMFDDADLYSGSYAGSWLANGSFEHNQGAFRSGQWNGFPNLSGFGQTNGGYIGETWANHSGNRGLAFYSFDSAGGSNWSVRMWQNVNPLGRTGVYTFALFLNYETNAWFSNAQMRIEWYDSTFSNRVQSDAVTNLTVPRDWAWHEFALETVLTNSACYEARVVFSANWTYQPPEIAGGDGRSTKMDDLRFLPTPYSELTNAMITDWCYHSTVGYNAQIEQVPGTNVGSFMQVNYGTTSVTFYVLANSPSQARYYPAEGTRWEIRTSWQDPGNGFAWTNNFAEMSKVGDVVIPSGSPFHGQPVAGASTAVVWKCVWPLPKDIGGVPYTNRIPVYYAPFVKTTNGPLETSYNYLLSWNSGFTTPFNITNNIGQQLGREPNDRDFYFDIHPIVNTFTNGGFENPIPENLDNTGWWGFGGATRGTNWPKRTGEYGAYFPTWDPNHSTIYQDVAVTGGMYVFSTWLQVQIGATPAAASLNMQWFDKNGRLVQENKKELLTVPQGSWWNRAYVMGGCAATNLDHVRLSVDASYGDGSVAFTEGFMMDDAQFAAVQASGLVNTGFEAGADGDLTNWYGYTTYEHNWGGWPHSGSQFAGIHGWETTEAQYESFVSQPMMASTGQYTMSVWLKRESDFHMSNAVLKIEWYDGTLSNKVQADTTATVTVPNDATWYVYSVTGTCLNANLRAIVPGVLLEWGRFGSGSQAMGLDDFSLEVTNGTPGETYTDGIPNSWLTLYGLGLTNGVATGDDDSDGYLNIEEYAGATIPTDINSHFPKATNTLAPRNVMVLIVNPSSSVRMYDAYWKTNLVDYVTPWQSYGLSVQGNGAAITLTVTNDDVAGKRYFRTGATLLP